MTSKKLLLAGLVAALGLAGSVQAAVVTITPSISAVLNPDFSPVEGVVGTTLDPRDDYYLLQVEVQVKTTDLGAAVGFSNTAFNSKVEGTGASLYVDVDLGVNAWTPDNPQFDSNGPAPGGNVAKWDINSDDGAANDLQGVVLAGITKAFGPVQYDIRRTLTTVGEGEHAGTFYIKLDGAAGSSASATIMADFGASTYDAAGTSNTAGNSAVGGSTETYQVVPEPSTVALLGLGSVLLAFARKRR
jgi:hypothetical protein